MVSSHMKLGLVLFPILIYFSHGIFFGVFEGSIETSSQDKIIDKEHTALSWLLNEVFHPRKDIFSEEDVTNLPCLGVTCQEVVDVSFPFDVNDLISAWLNNAARNWTVDEVIEWLSTDSERSGLLSNYLARNQVNGQRLPSLLVTELAQSDHDSITTEDLLWLKDRIASLILFGPPSPNTVSTAITVSTTCTMIMLITCLWLLWCQLIVSYRVMVRLSRRFDQVRDSLDQLQASLDSAQCLVSRNLKASTPQPDYISIARSESKIHNLSQALWHSMENEVGLLKEISSFVEGVIKSMEADTIRNPSIRLWQRHNSSIEGRIECFASMVDRLQLRVRDLTCRLSTPSMPISPESPRSPNTTNREHVSQQTPNHVTSEQDETRVSAELASDRQTDCSKSPYSPLKTPVLSVSYQEYCQIPSSYSVTTARCSAPGSDSETNMESDALSDGSPKENRPALRLTEESHVEHKPCVTGTKIPQPRRFSAQALTPSFFVMNPPVPRWDNGQSSLVTPSHIPVGTRKPLTTSTAVVHSYPSISTASRLRSGSTHTDTSVQCGTKS